MARNAHHTWGAEVKKIPLSANDFRQRCADMSARGGAHAEFAEEAITLWSAMDRLEEKIEKALRGEF
jgi:hypothetical protein